jgi:hypothetical protein
MRKFLIAAQNENEDILFFKTSFSDKNLGSSAMMEILRVLQDTARIIA